MNNKYPASKKHFIPDSAFSKSAAKNIKDDTDGFVHLNKDGYTDDYNEHMKNTPNKHKLPNSQPSSSINQQNQKDPIVTPANVVKLAVIGLIIYYLRKN